MTPHDHTLAHNKYLSEQLDKVRSELVEARNETMEQARLLGAGGSREAALISQRDRLAQALFAALKNKLK
jgi:hypothetical protein